MRSRQTLVAAVLGLCVSLAPSAFAQPPNQGGVGSPSFIITAPVTYYVCAKANGSGCAYNGATTTAPIISDDNSCLAPAEPCRTLTGVKNKIAGKMLNAVVTIQFADAAGTGTDLYEPAGVVFDNRVLSSEPDATLWAEENASSGAYPRAYLYFVGNTTTPGNVAICGSSSCTTTTPPDTRGIVVTGTVARFNGLGPKYFGSNASSSAVQCIRSVCYVENSTFTGTGAASDQEWFVFCYDHAICRFGGTFTVTNAGMLDLANYTQGNFLTPAGRSNITITVASGTFNAGLLFANESSYLAVDGITLSVSGAGTSSVFRAYNRSGIYWNDDNTFTAPAQTVSIQGNGFTMDEAADWSMVSDLCRTAGQLTCSIGTTTAIAKKAAVTRNGYIKYLQTPAGVLGVDTADTFGEINGATAAFIGLPSTTFANLPALANGSVLWCSDCASPSNPATGASTGAQCVRQNGAWKCY